MCEPLIRERTPAETLAHIAGKLRDQPDATALLGHSLTLDILAENMAAGVEGAGVEALGRLNRSLAELGMSAAVLTLEAGREPSGWPVAVVRLVRADDPEVVYGEIRIPFEAVPDA